MAGGLGNGMEWAYECVENKKPHRQLCGLVEVRVEKLSGMQKIMHKFDESPPSLNLIAAWTQRKQQSRHQAGFVGSAELFRQFA